MQAVPSTVVAGAVGAGHAAGGPPLLDVLLEVTAPVEVELLLEVELVVPMPELDELLLLLETPDVVLPELELEVLVESEPPPPPFPVADEPPQAAAMTSPENVTIEIAEGLVMDHPEATGRSQPDRRSLT